MLSLMQPIQLLYPFLQFSTQGVFRRPPFPVAAQSAGEIHARLAAKIKEILQWGQGEDRHRSPGSADQSQAKSLPFTLK